VRITGRYETPVNQAFIDADDYHVNVLVIYIFPRNSAISMTNETPESSQKQPLPRPERSSCVALDAETALALVLLGMGKFVEENYRARP
jgi:hypothetical protein